MIRKNGKLVFPRGSCSVQKMSAKRFNLKRLRSRARRELGVQLAQKRPLIFDDLCHRGGQREVGNTIDLRKASALPRPRRPLHLEGVARKGREIEIGFERPGMHELAALLSHRRERVEGAAAGGQIRFFGKFSLSGGEKIAPR